MRLVNSDHGVALTRVENVHENLNNMTYSDGLRTGLEFDEVLDLSCGDIDLHRIVDADQRVGVTDGTGVVGDNVRHSLRADHQLLHLTQLVLKPNTEAD